MERIFWAKCPKCGGKFYCDYALRFATVKLICPFCEREFFASESPDIDDRWKADDTNPGEARATPVPGKD